MDAMSHEQTRPVESAGRSQGPRRVLLVGGHTAAPGARRGAGDAEFQLELRRGGRTLTVPAGSSVLAAVRRALPDTAYSCEQGFCGTCRQRVLEGEADHRDGLLTDAERTDSLLICVSRTRGDRLVLDM